MKPSFRANTESSASRAKRVSAIKKAVQEGSYEINSTKVADILIIHLLHRLTVVHRSAKQQCTLGQLVPVP